MEMLTTHRLKQGEKLEQLSAKYHVPVCMIMRANEMADTGGVIALDKIKIPRRCYCNRCAEHLTCTVKYEMVTVQPGDTIMSIAQRYGITMRIVMNTNCLDNPSMLRAGDVVSVPLLSGIRYTVRPGDTLSDIARAHNISETALRSVNCIKPDEQVYGGMLLILPEQP